MAIRIRHDDEHTIEVIDELGTTYMALLTQRLNQALREHGIDDEGKRQDICESFMFGFAYELDAGWFRTEGERFFPKVCFLERARPEEDENLGAVKVVHLPNEASSWHEYAQGVVGEYFDADESLDPAITTGSYEAEDE